MKVLFIAKYYSPHIGGVEKHLENISHLLVKKGYKITILTEKYNEKLSLNENINGVKVIRFSYPKIKYIGLFIIWREIFKKRKLLEQSNIIHIQDVGIWYLPFKFLLPKKRFYLTVQGWEGKYPIPLKNKLLKMISVKMAYKTILVGKYLEKYYGIRGDTIIYGGATRNNMKIISKDPNSIVYVGRLEEDTGLKVFLKALKYNRKYRVEFCGDGPLSDECKKYGKVHGFVDPNSYLSKALICFASGYLTIIEALANKCIVLSAYNNEMRSDILKMTPFCNYINKVNSTAKVISSLNINKLSIERANAGYKWAREQTWEQILKEYEKLWS